MNKISLFVLAFTLLAGTVWGQSNDFDTYMSAGVNLYDHGRYYDAIAEYQKALAIDSNSASANLEMANTYIVIENYPKAIWYADKVMYINTKYVDQAYVAKGTALDLMKNQAEARAIFEEGVKRFPNEYLLLYNAALTCHNSGRNDDAAMYAARAVAANPVHASSNALLGAIMTQMGRNTQSLMASYHFLFLEPLSKRAVNMLDVVVAVMHSGVSVKNDSTTVITIAGLSDRNEFSAADMLLGILAAGNTLPDNAKKPRGQLFFEHTQTLLKIVDGIKKDERNESVWWTTYAPFYHSLISSGNLEAFCYFISQCKHDTETKEWISAHEQEMAKLTKWRDAYLKEH
jgi:tetratricopeptide (TPR) repeat protein